MHPPVGDAVTELPVASIKLLTPRAWGEAPVVGDSFREGSVVIVNLSEMDYADARRMIDFVSGLVFVVHGTLDRVTKRVFLLAPPGVQVCAADDAGPGRDAVYNQS